jgi:hypothetical protein
LCMKFYAAHEEREHSKGCNCTIHRRVPLEGMAVIPPPGESPGQSAQVPESTIDTLPVDRSDQRNVKNGKRRCARTLHSRKHILHTPILFPSSAIQASPWMPPSRSASASAT